MGALEDGEGDFGAGFGIGQGVVVVGEGDAEEVAEVGEGEGGAEGAGDGAPGFQDGAEERVVGVGDAVEAVGGSDAFFIERFVGGYQGEVAYEWGEALPYLGKEGGGVGVEAGDAVDFFGEIAEVEVGLGTHELIKTVSNQAVNDLYRPDVADGGGMVVGCLYVYCDKIIHV